MALPPGAAALPLPSSVHSQRLHARVRLVVAVLLLTLSADCSIAQADNATCVADRSVLHNNERYKVPRVEFVKRNLYCNTNKDCMFTDPIGCLFRNCVECLQDLDLACQATRTQLCNLHLKADIGPPEIPFDISLSLQMFICDPYSCGTPELSTPAEDIFIVELWREIRARRVAGVKKLTITANSCASNTSHVPKTPPPLCWAAPSPAPTPSPSGACLRGTFSDTGLQPCVPCPLGHFQDQLGRTSCKTCPGAMTTLGPGSASCDKKCLFDQITDVPNGIVECTTCPDGRMPTLGRTRCYVPTPAPTPPPTTTPAPPRPTFDNVTCPACPCAGASCRFSRLQCQNEATLPSCAPTIPCRYVLNEQQWRRSTKCTCPRSSTGAEFFRGSDCQFINKAAPGAACGDGNMIDATYHNSKEVRNFECAVAWEPKTELLVLRDHRVIVSANIAEGKLSVEIHSRHFYDQTTICSPMHAVATCAFSECQANTVNGDLRYRCEKKVCTGCPNADCANHRHGRMMAAAMSDYAGNSDPAIFDVMNMTADGRAIAHFPIRTSSFSLTIPLTCVTGDCVHELDELPPELTSEPREPISLVPLVSMSSALGLYLLGVVVLVCVANRQLKRKDTLAIEMRPRKASPVLPPSTAGRGRGSYDMDDEVEGADSLHSPDRSLLDGKSGSSSSSGGLRGETLSARIFGLEADEDAYDGGGRGAIVGEGAYAADILGVGANVAPGAAASSAFSSTPGSAPLPPAAGGAGPDRGRSCIAFHNVMYAVKTTVVLPSPGLTGLARGGELVAILGKSGSGKSTLLEILAGIPKEGETSGDVCIFRERGGRVVELSPQSAVGFVHQHFAFLSTQTVMERLVFAQSVAPLPDGARRPDAATLQSQVWQALMDLGIERNAHDQLRGLSGGELRRVMVAEQLLQHSGVILLDEPTSGLDVDSALKLIQQLKKVAVRRQIPIIASVHQPDACLWNLFDSVIAMKTGGEIVFQGPRRVSQAVLDDVLAADRGQIEAPGAVHHQQNHHQPASGSPSQAPAAPAAAAPPRSSINHATILLLATAIPEGVHSVRQHRETQRCRSEIEQATRSFVAQVKEADASAGVLGKVAGGAKKRRVANGGGYAQVGGDATVGGAGAGGEKDDDGYSLVRTRTQQRSCLKLTYLLSMRSFKHIARDPQQFYTQFAATFLVAAVLGLVFWQMDYRVGGIQNRLGALLFIVVYFSLTAMASLGVFIAERELFVRECHGARWYGALPYLASKVVAEILPMRLLPALIFGTVVYYMMGLRQDNEGTYFLIFQYFLSSAAVAASSVCFFIGSFATTVRQANYCAVLFMMFCMIYSGLFLNTSTGGSWQEAIKYLSFMRYSYEGMTVNELHKLPLVLDVADYPEIDITGDVILENWNLDPANLKPNMKYLAYYNVAFLAASFFALKFLNRKSR